jgi:drug/metabolite transporter (DMT)-like permease
VFGFAVTTQMYLARTLPPLAASLSVMLIPILGVFSGATLLGEVLHWQDWAAVGLMMLSIAAVLIMLWREFIDSPEAGAAPQTSVPD